MCRWRLFTSWPGVGLFAIIFSISLFTANVAATESDPAYRLAIELRTNYLFEQPVTINATLESFDDSFQVTGFDLAISYDPSTLWFKGANPGDVITEDDWEYFLYQVDSVDQCQGECPKKIIRFVGLAELSVGFRNKVGSPRNLFQMTFQPLGDYCDLNCVYSPMRWYWSDCQDNFLTTPNPEERLVSRMVHDAGCYPEWGDCEDIADTTAELPSIYGLPHDCLSMTSTESYRIVDFIHGGVDFICFDGNCIDYSGDINLNGLRFETADFFMFHQYFLEGLTAFGSHIEGSIWASDVNADSIRTHVSDLVAFGLILSGEIDRNDVPILPTVGDVIVRYSHNTCYHSLELISDDTLGAVALTIAGHVQPSLVQTQDSLFYNYVSDSTLILIEGKELYQPASQHQGLLLTWESQPGSGEISRLQTSSRDGSARTVFLDGITSADEQTNGALPESPYLYQNYPNPFNPSTEIRFTLPNRTQVKLVVFNVMGQQIATLADQFYPAGEHSVHWNGTDQEGNQVASGIYLYRITTDGYTESRKMLLLK